MSSEDNLDINGNKTLTGVVCDKTKEDIEFLYERFLKECSHGGRMNEEKFIKFYAKFLDDEDNAEEIARYCFNAFDTNKDKHIDFGEFLIGYAITTGNDNRKKLRYMFQIYDRDHSESIDKAEIRLVLGTMFKLLKMNKKNVNFDKCLENVMKSLDKNGDKMITIEEFIDGVLSDSVLQTLLSPFSLIENDS